MSIPTSSDLEIKTSLETDPHLHFLAWLDELVTLASAQCAEYSVRGAQMTTMFLVPARPVYDRPPTLDRKQR